MTWGVFRFLVIGTIVLGAWSHTAAAQQLFLGNDQPSAAGSSIYNAPRDGDGRSNIHLKSTQPDTVFTRKTKSLRATIPQNDDAALLLQTKIANEQYRSQQQALARAQVQRNAAQTGQFLAQLEARRQAELAANAQRFMMQQQRLVSDPAAPVGASSPTTAPQSTAAPRPGVFIKREKTAPTTKRLFNPY